MTTHPTSGPGGRTPRTRLPSLGRRGGGWVTLQFLLLGGAVVTGLLGARWPSPVRPWLAVLGGVVTLAGIALMLAGGAGLGRQLTPFPRPVSDGRLRRDGVYGVVRHPMYGGALALVLGWALLFSPLVLLVLGPTVVLLDAKSRREEAWLADTHPEYADYRATVPHRFLPRPW